MPGRIVVLLRRIENDFTSGEKAHISATAVDQTPRFDCRKMSQTPTHERLPIFFGRLKTTSLLFHGKVTIHGRFE